MGCPDTGSAPKLIDPLIAYTTPRHPTEHYIIKLGFLLGYSGKHIHIPLDLIKQAESMGYDSVWTAEAYGNDAVTSATWVLASTSKIRVGTAIMQMYKPLLNCADPMTEFYGNFQMDIANRS